MEGDKQGMKRGEREVVLECRTVHAIYLVPLFPKFILFYDSQILIAGD